MFVHIFVTRTFILAVVISLNTIKDTIIFLIDICVEHGLACCNLHARGLEMLIVNPKACNDYWLFCWHAALRCHPWSFLG